ECASIFGHVEPADSGIVAIPAVPANQKHIWFVPVPATPLAYELIERVPAVLVRGGGLRADRRLRHHLPPEKTHQVGLDAVRHHSARDENLRRAVAIKIMRIRRPRPSAHFDAFGGAGFRKRSLA